MIKEMRMNLTSKEEGDSSEKELEALDTEYIPFIEEYAVFLNQGDK